MDRVEVRRRNLLPKDVFPYTTPTGAVYDSGDYEARARARRSSASTMRKRVAERDRRSAAGELVGIGVATFTEICGLGPSTGAFPASRAGTWESAELRVEPTGAVTVMTGARRTARARRRPSRSWSPTPSASGSTTSRSCTATPTS